MAPPPGAIAPPQAMMAPPPSVAPVVPQAPRDLAPPAMASAPAPSEPPAAPDPVAAPEPSAAPKPRLVGAGASNAPSPRPAMDGRHVAAVPSLNEGAKALLSIQDSILERLVPDLGLDGLALDRLGDEELWQRAESAIVDLVETMESGGTLPDGIDQDQLIKETLNEALGLGPLEDLLADDTIEEIIVDGTDRILIARSGAIGSANTGFSSEEVFRRVVDRLVAPTGLVIDASNPIVNARLRDGALLSMVLPPVSSRGPCLTLRKPSGRGEDLRSLEARGVLSGAMVSFLGTCLSSRKSVLVCGASNSGKNSVLGAMASDAPAHERLVSVEEFCSLKISRPHWIALESRPGDGNGVPKIGVEELLRGALRMHPDRLVVGDIRGAEAFELVQVMLASFDGTLASIGGEGALSALGRLASLAALSCAAESAARREMVSAAVDIVIHVVRYGDGKVRIASIDEVTGAGSDGFVTQNIFRYDEAGEHVASGAVPGFYSELGARGIAADTSIFQ